MVSLRDLVDDTDDDDDENYLMRVAKESAAFLRRKRQQRRARGQEAFAEEPFTNTDALKWEEESLAALEAEYPSLGPALVAATAAATVAAASRHRHAHQDARTPHGPLETSSEANDAVSLRALCLHAVKMWYGRVWVIPAFTIPHAHFTPLCADAKLCRTARGVENVRVEALVAPRGKCDAYSEYNYDYSEERCLVQVLREAIQLYDDKGDITDRQRVLALWPEGDRSTRKNARVAAVLRSIAIERAKRQQWNQHVAEQLAGAGCDAALETAAAASAAIAATNNGPLKAVSVDESSTLATSPISRRGAAPTSTALFPEDISRRVPGDEDDEAESTILAGERLYWPAFVRRVVGVFEGHSMFLDTPLGLAELQGYDDVGDVIAAALRCPMRLCVDVVFAVDEVSVCRRLDVSPNILYAPPRYYAFVQAHSEKTVAAVREVLGVQGPRFPGVSSARGGETSSTMMTGTAAAGPRSQRRLAQAQIEEDAESVEGDAEVIAAVREAYASGNGCTVAEANEWMARVRHPQACPLLTPEALPEVISIRNMSFTPAATESARSGDEQLQRPRGTLNAASLSNTPISVYDLLAGPTCQTRSLVLLRVDTAGLSRAQSEAIKDIVERWRRLRQALVDRITAYEEEPPRPVKAESATPITTASPSPARPFVQLPTTFETPFIESSAERAEALPPEPLAQENMTEAQLRDATRVPHLQSHGARTLGSVIPAGPLTPPPHKQTRAPSKSRAVSAAPPLPSRGGHVAPAARRTHSPTADARAAGHAQETTPSRRHVREADVNVTDQSGSLPSQSLSRSRPRPSPPPPLPSYPSSRPDIDTSVEPRRQVDEQKSTAPPSMRTAAALSTPSEMHDTALRSPSSLTASSWLSTRHPRTRAPPAPWPTTHQTALSTGGQSDRAMRRAAADGDVDKNPRDVHRDGDGDVHSEDADTGDHEVGLPWERPQERSGRQSRRRRQQAGVPVPSTQPVSVRSVAEDEAAPKHKRHKRGRQSKNASLAAPPPYVRTGSLPEVVSTVTPRHATRSARTRSPSPEDPSACTRRPRDEEEEDGGHGGVAGSSSPSASSSPSPGVKHDSPRPSETKKKAKKFVLVRRIVRRDPFDENAFVPLPSIGIPTPRASVEPDDRHEACEDGVSPLLSLMPWTEDVVLSARPGATVSATTRVPKADTSAQAGFARVPHEREEGDSPSASRVQSRAPFPYSRVASARHGSATRRGQLPVDWGTSPLRSLSFRGSRSQSLPGRSALETRSLADPTPSISFDVYSLARTAVVPHTVDREEGRHSPRRSEQARVHHPAAVRVRASAPPEALEPPSLKGRQDTHSAFYVRAQSPVVTRGAGPHVTSPDPSQPLMTSPTVQTGAFHRSAADRGDREGPVQFRRTDHTPRARIAAKKPGDTHHSTA